MNLELLLHFLKFDIRTNSLEIKEWIERHYASNDLTRRFPHKSTSIKLCVERIDAPDAAPIRQSTRGSVFAETNLCNARCYYDEGGRFYAANDGDYRHETEYDLNTHTIRANLGGKFLENGQAIVSNLIRPILQSFILPFYGLKTIHGAVLSRDGRTILLRGHGGMGKTTTAIQLMRAGYELLSDDGPFFFTDNSHVYTLSSLDYLHLTENTLRMFPELKGRVIGAKDSREKYAVRISDLQGGCSAWTKPLRITEYIQLKRSGGVVVPRIRKINRNVVHRSLLDEGMVIFRRAPFRASAYPFNEYSEFVFDLLTKVVQGAEICELEFADHHLPEIHKLIGQL